MTLMVVLGAGASADAVPAARHPRLPSQGWLLPVTAGLFGDRTQFNEIVIGQYPRSLGAIHELRTRVENGAELETELAKLEQGAETYAPDKVALAGIRFYLQEIIYKCGSETGRFGFTNQLMLARLLDIWRNSVNEPVLYVTFNYDTLLEQALQFVLNYRFSLMRDYVSDYRFTLVKLHGSVDWWHPIDGRFRTDSRKPHKAMIIDDIATLGVRGDRYIYKSTIEPIGDQSPAAPGIEAEVELLFPALAIPVEQKPHFECPPDHLEALRQALPTVDRVLMIGWRAREEHFLDVLAELLNKDARALVVTGSPRGAETVRTRLTDRVGLHRWVSPQSQPAGGFSNLIAGDLIDQLLNDDVAA